jgi:hypothetical protein
VTREVPSRSLILYQEERFVILNFAPHGLGDGIFQRYKIIYEEARRPRLNFLKISWLHRSIINCKNPLAPFGKGDCFLKQALNLLLMGAEDRK